VGSANSGPALLRKKNPPFQLLTSLPAFTPAFDRLISVIPSVAIEVWPTHRRPKVLLSRYQALWRRSSEAVEAVLSSRNWLTPGFSWVPPLLAIRAPISSRKPADQSALTLASPTKRKRVRLFSLVTT
jgi:hypothetical protein